MSRNEDFDNAFWSQRVVEDLSADATLLYIWSWTNPRCGMAGIYEVGRRAMTESKVSDDGLDAALGELATVQLVLYVEDVLWVIARVKRLRTKSLQMAKSVAKDVAGINPDHPLRVRWLEHHRNASWLRGALSERHLNHTRGSGEPPKTKAVELNAVNLTRTSPEVPLTGQGEGSSKTSSQGQRRSDARAQVDEAVSILAARWEPDEVAVENCAAMYPSVDLLQGCRLAVTWASDPSWEITSCAATLRSAMRKLDAEMPKVKASTKRGLALDGLMARTEPVADVA